MKHLARIAGLLAALLLAVTARADKIVLKNGRQIVAYNVVEEGDKVSYETSAGQLSIPKSIVDHVEKGSMPAMELPPMAPPSKTTEIDHDAVRDGAIDREYIARIEGEARGGGAKAKERAALAHHAAAQYELSKGDLENALSDERAALNYKPEDPAMLINMAYLHLRRSEFKQALDYLDRAKRFAPNNADVYKLAGWAYYRVNRLELAVADWKRSLELRPDADVRVAMEKALRDEEEEESYRENESAHFQLKYNGTAEPALARQVLHTLEGHYSQIEAELSYTPPDPIGVVLYTQQGFADITQAPNWVGALNDGRIRVPVQGLTGVTPELSRVLRHELTHSFVDQKTHGQAPTWLQEGIAQWMEGKRSDETAAALVKIFDQGQAKSLGELEGPWLNLSSDVVHYSYAWALANIEYIVQTQGMADVEEILDRIARGSTTEQALQDVLHDDYGDLMLSTSGYLRKKYVQ